MLIDYLLFYKIKNTIFINGNILHLFNGNETKKSLITQ